MNLLARLRRSLVAVCLILFLVTTTACTTTAPSDRAAYRLEGDRTTYSQIKRGNTAQGQEFGDWVVQASKGLIKDAYVRGNDILGAVISPQVRPTEVRSLAKSLMQGFEKNFPNRNLTVLMYAPDKKLILTARYDKQTRQIEYEAAS
ncbi:hypothetical protein Ple7327_0349 [Pleurocapsa sp. PCC 7327]|uniref:hypothetical protein n=1 Tax=Pleurocapsa sp. PCC 7327 TaxID=118163 RepID=UPI00029FCCF2|nr:hypothetical protein [Pleurocapsa sp. PCC 7327]AFY75811.1 hypothetical protein Ple7327_0349 [Pleurocapsa sp. PCC 7327]